MQTYQQYRPTAFDGCGLNAETLGIGAWLVAPVIRTRDSGCLEESNFHSFLDALGGESDSVQVHRFGHWGPGWFEIIVIDPADTIRIDTATEIESALEDYPIVDESDFSRREWETVCQTWEQMRVRDRVQWLQRHAPRVSVFAARRSEVPDVPDWSSLAE